MLFKEVIAVYSENVMKLINTVWKNAELVVISKTGINKYSCHWALRVKFQSSCEIQMTWSFTFTSLFVFIAYCLNITSIYPCLALPLSYPNYSLQVYFNQIFGRYQNQLTPPSKYPHKLGLETPERSPYWTGNQTSHFELANCGNKVPRDHGVFLERGAILFQGFPQGSRIISGVIKQMHVAYITLTSSDKRIQCVRKLCHTKL
jgi:hypothetical protein